MATYEALRQAIDSTIRANGNNEITGEILNNVLNAMITALGANYQFCGEAKPSTNPGQPLQNVFYFAYDAGTYTNFGNITLPLGISTLSWDGTQWIGDTIYQIDTAAHLNSTKLITSGAVWNEIHSIYTGIGYGKMYEGIATPSTVPSGLEGVRKFYIATQAGTYQHFFSNGDIPLVIPHDGIWVISSVTGDDNDDWYLEDVMQLDNIPTKDSGNPVKSGGVFNNIGAFDISELNATENPHTQAKYADLAAALNALPTQYRKGGMSVKFVQSSDNKYVQFLYLLEYENTTAGNAAFTLVSNWMQLNVEEKLVDNLTISEKPTLVLEQGGIMPTTGESSPTSIRVRTSDFITARYVCIKSSGSKIYVFGYTDTGNFVDSVGYITNNSLIHINGADKYRFVFGAGDDHTITPSDFETLGISVNVVGRVASEKNVNNKIKTLKAETDEKIGGEYEPVLDIEQGGIEPASGEDTAPMETLIRTSNFTTAQTIKITITENIGKIYVLGYKDNGLYVNGSGWITGNQNVHINGADKYRFVFGKTDNGNVHPSDFFSLGISLLADATAIFALKDIEGKVPVLENVFSSDFVIADEDNNALVIFKDGHIQTKFFDSKNIVPKSSQLSTIIYQEQGNPFGIVAEKYFRRGVFRMNPTYQPLIIVVGQSNADGRAPYSTAPQWLVNNGYGIPGYKVYDTATGKFQDYNVKGMSGNGGDPAGSSIVGKDKFAFDPFFAKRYLEEHPGKTLYLVRQTVGDVGIYDMPTTGVNWTWNADIDNIPSGCHSMCISLMTKLSNAYTVAQLNGVVLIPVAILWHQGEHDAKNQTEIDAYKQNLSNLISWMRGILSAPTLPFLNAYIIGTYSSLSPQINTIFNEIADLDKYMKCVDMTNYFSETVGDGLHYNATALEYMGEQMYNNFKMYE